MSLEEVALLVLVGAVSAFINTLAGGGSMLTLPALMMIGLPADLANGTNRVAVLAQSVTGAHGFDQAGQLDRSALISILMPTISGAALGALAASILPNSWLKPILLITMMIVALSLLVPRKSVLRRPTALKEKSRWPALALFITGLYGGFIQAGVGFMLVAVISRFLQYDLVRSNAIKAVCTGVFSGVALLVFAIQGQVLWLTGVVLALGSIAGAYLSVRFTLNVRESVLRTLLVIMVMSSCVAALWI